MTKLKLNGYRTWIEISTRAIRHNLQTFKKLIRPETKLLGVVKSNAYGHELLGMGQTLESFGVDWLGVDSISEALALRSRSVKTPILVLGYTMPENFIMAAKHRCAITISDFIHVRALKKIKQPLTIHLKVDTGMHRQGFQMPELSKVLAQLKSLPHITIGGMFTHFGAAKKPDRSGETLRQLAKFRQAIDLYRSHGLAGLVHASATAAILNYPEAQFDMVRLGIGLYGLWPSPETYTAHHGRITLQPVLAWKTMISELKWVEKGEKVGYDYTEELKRPTRLAVLPIGYWHGYWRAFSSKAHVLVRGVRCKIIGRVSMDMVVVDVTDVKKVSVGDEVVLLGTQGKQKISAEELAGIAGTTNYEIVTRLNPLIKKVFK